jgi:tetratricopeptide (TPR) repeat protein
MSMIYFSWVPPELEPLVERLAAACESFLEGECVLEKQRDGFVQDKIKKSLARCDALFVVVGGESPSVERPGLPVDDRLLDERFRFEIVTAMNFGLLVISLLIDDAGLPEKKNAPGVWKRLLECKSYRLRTASWSEELCPILEDIEEELNFKKEVEGKLSQSIYQNYQDLTDAEGRPIQPLELGLEFSGALELRRVIESERFNLEEARRLRDRAGEKNALSALALAFTELGQTQRAIQYFQEQLVIVREAEDVEEECGLLASLGDAFAISGNIEIAKKHYEEQLLRADAKGFRAFVGSAYNGLGYVFVKEKKISRAIECYLKALAIYREFENHDKELELLVGIGLNYQKTGALEQAVECFEQALQAAKYLENRREEVHILADLTETYCRLENPKRAHTHLGRAEEILSHRKETWAIALSDRFVALRDLLSQK